MPNKINVNLEVPKYKFKFINKCFRLKFLRTHRFIHKYISS